MDSGFHAAGNTEIMDVKSETWKSKLAMIISLINSLLFTSLHFKE